MFATLRLAMSWVHTWFGLALGYVLMVVVFFGTLSVFDREIDRWTVPETRFPAQAMPSFDGVLAPAFERIAEAPAAAGPRRLTAVSAFRTHRDRTVSLYADFVAEGTGEELHGEATLDPRTGALLPESAFFVGTKLFYPIHVTFRVERANLGYWLVGLAGFGMLVGLVSGVVIHRRLFRELFTFRPWKSAQRATLDLHDLTGVAALPFHLVFAFTGLVIFAGIYLPLGETIFAKAAARHERQESAARGLAEGRAGTAAPLASVDTMIAEAKRRWSERGVPGDVGFLVVRHPGDANASVSVYQAGKDRVTMSGEGVHFSGTTGRVLSEDPPQTTVARVASYLTAIHLQPFEHWPLRWLYLLGGIAGCVCIATGMVLFVEKRRAKLPAARWADAFAVATVLGPIVACVALLVANRALPASSASPAWQERVFWAAWTATFVHAALRTRAPRPWRAWADQSLAIAVLAAAAVIANAISTGDHLGRTVARGDWAVAGVDAALVLAAVIATAAARRLRRAAGATDA